MKIENQHSDWATAYLKQHLLLISGPCSAESEAQIMQMAEALTKLGVPFMRAGVWKPRTKPGSFEGIGEPALEWLKKAKQKTGIKIAIEVANAQHVALSKAYDIDLVWLGARTTVNPFLVQEIAEALGKTEQIVLVKNPVNPDLDLWQGAIERLYSQGVTKLGAIHRGFSSYRKTKFRNPPQWQIPIDLKARFPELILLCDPSHICGNRSGIAAVSQTAMDLKFDGLMIESHPQPDAALSDAQQQITPKALAELLNGLHVRQIDFNEQRLSQNIKILRREIASLDSRIIELLSERMKLAEEIGKIKHEANVAILQQEIWISTLDKMQHEGEIGGLSSDFIEAFFKAIHQESIAHQQKMFD